MTAEGMAFGLLSPKMNSEHEVLPTVGHCCCKDQISARLTKNLLMALLLSIVAKLDCL